MGRPGAGVMDAGPGPTLGHPPDDLHVGYLYFRSSAMAGSQALRPRGVAFAATLTAFFLASADLARAQYPPPTPATPAQSFADLVETETPPAVTPVLPPSYYPGVAPTPPRVTMGLFDTVSESLCGKPDPNT